MITEIRVEPTLFYAILELAYVTAICVCLMLIRDAIEEHK